MPTQELTASDQIYKLWAWFEDNFTRVIIGAVILTVVVFSFSYYSYHLKQKEVAAGQALSKVMISSSTSQQAGAYLKVAAEYPGTIASQRALLEGAATLFTTGKFAEAQTQFKKFLDTYPDSNLTPSALLGAAASLDAQDKTNLAISAYERAAGQTANSSVAASAKFSIARIYAAQGKTAEAARLYETVARTFPNSSLSNEAGLRAMELKTKSPDAAADAAKPAPAAVSPFILSK